MYIIVSYSFLPTLQSFHIIIIHSIIININIQMNWRNYIILLITIQFLYGMANVYSIQKKQIQQELQLSQDFFGLVEMLIMIGRCISTLYLIFVPSRPNLTYFVCCVLHVVSYIIVCIPHFVPSLTKPLFIIGFSIFGLSGGIQSFVYLLLDQNFSGPESVKAVNIWIGLSNFGEAYGILIGSFCINVMKWNWVSGLLISSAVYFITGILTYVYIPEIQIQKKEKDPKENDLSQIIKVIHEFYKKKKSNTLLLLDYCFQENQMYLVIFWIPFYFEELGFGSGSTLAALTFPVSYCLAAFTIVPYFGSITSNISIITSIFVFLQFFFFFILLFVESQFYYILFLFLGFYTMAYPYARVNSNQIIERTDDERQKYLVINFMTLMRQLVTGLSLLWVGYLIKQNTRYYLYFLILNGAFVLIMHLMRRVVEYYETQDQQNKGGLETQFLELKDR